jgi:hypothetical protein
MNKKKVKLIIKNMELLIQSLKLELEEKEEEKNIIKLQDIVAEKLELIDEYEPDYYEER